MRTLEYLTNPALAGLFWPGVLTAGLISIVGGALSWLVVVKRLSFIGQGISHSAFGGVGLALVLGFGATSGSMVGTLIVLAFAIAAALGISALTDRRSNNADTAIGIVLSVTMALGFLLHHRAQLNASRAGQFAPPSLEQVLFGSITMIGWQDLAVAAAAVSLILAAVWWHRRGLLFWMFDEAAAPAFGVKTNRARALVLILLAAVVVITMKLAGVVLATAVLVLPAATAMKLSLRLATVITLGIALTLLGTAAGLVLSFELDVQPGPMIVLVLGLIYGAAHAFGPVRS